MSESSPEPFSIRAPDVSPELRERLERSKTELPVWRQSKAHTRTVIATACCERVYEFLSLYERVWFPWLRPDENPFPVIRLFWWLP